jgi:hypothetical protein
VVALLILHDVTKKVGYSTASHRRGPGSIPGQSMVEFVVDRVALRLFFEYFVFRLTVSFHQCSMFIPLFFTKAIKRQKLPLSLNNTLKIMVNKKWQTHTSQIL